MRSLKNTIISLCMIIFAMVAITVGTTFACVDLTEKDADAATTVYLYFQIETGYKTGVYSTDSSASQVEKVTVKDASTGSVYATETGNAYSSITVSLSGDSYPNGLAYEVVPKTGYVVNTTKSGQLTLAGGAYRVNIYLDRTQAGPTNDSYWDEHTSELDTTWAGSGTESDPYLISSAAELAGLSYMLYSRQNKYNFKYFKQTADIDVSKYYWQPIGIQLDRSGGYPYYAFSADCYDGNGYKVTGIFTKSINNKSVPQGLFGYVNDSMVIKNLGIEDSIIRGYYSVGAIVGSGSCGIVNCYNKATVISETGYAGGLVGATGITTSVLNFKNCYNSGDISGYSHAGGLVGYACTMVMNHCYNTGEVKGTDGSCRVGGLAGEVNSTAGTSYYVEISNSFSLGGIIGAGISGRGGILGELVGKSARTLQFACCYSDYAETVGAYVGEGEYTGTIYDEQIWTVIDEAWLTTESNWGLTDKLASANQEVAWNFTDTWMFKASENDGLPVLKAFYYRTLKIYRPEGIYDVIKPNSIWQSDSGGSYKTVSIENGGSFTVEVTMKTGYKFKNWTNAAGTVLSTSNPYTFTMGNADTTIYPNAEKIRTKLTLKLNGGNVNGNTNDIVYNNAQNVLGFTGSLLAPTREGYIFKGWRATTTGDAIIRNLGKPILGYNSYQGEDPFFTNGNNVAVYNNQHNGTVTHTRENVSLQQSPYNTQQLKISNTGSSSPGLGGFTFETRSYANAEFISIFEAKIPLGYTVNWATNQIGASGDWEQGQWLTSQQGTGDWETYALYVKCDSSGSFSTTNYFYINGTPYGTTSNPVNWYLSQASVYDATGLNLNTDTIVANLSKPTTYTYGTTDMTIVAMWEPDLWTNYAATSFAGGNGTESNPYQIATAAQLAKLSLDSKSSNLSGKFYKLTADIDLSGHIWTGIGKFTSDYTLGFKGTIEGNYHVIRNMTTTIGGYEIPVDVEPYLALVNYLDNGTLRNIIVENATIKGARAGGLVGSMYGTVQNCIVRGANGKRTTIEATGGPAGGLFVAGGRLTAYCMVKGCTIKSTAQAAGLSGHTEGGYVDCAVIDVTISNGGYSNIFVSQIYNKTAKEALSGCYGQGKVNSTTTETKLMYGDSSAWGNWTYSSEMNNGYPVQTDLFWIGGQSGSANVYNYLKNTLGFTVG